MTSLWYFVIIKNLCFQVCLAKKRQLAVINVTEERVSVEKIREMAAPGKEKLCLYFVPAAFRFSDGTRSGRTATKGDSLAMCQLRQKMIDATLIS